MLLKIRGNKRGEYLGVIRIRVVGEVVGLDDLRDRSDVERKQDRTENRTLRDAKVKRRG